MVSNVADKAKCAHRIYFIEPHQKMWLETNILEGETSVLGVERKFRVTQKVIQGPK